MQLERSWRSNQNNSQGNNSSAQNVGSKDGNIDEMFNLRDKSASLGNSIASASSRSTMCVPFTKERIGSVKFDLPKFESFKNDSLNNNKHVGGDRDKEFCDIDTKATVLEVGLTDDEVPSACETNTLDNGERASLSISELNKLKRDAFFNNMDSQFPQGDSKENWAKEGSSDKVKRVIENFKSEINKTKRDMSELDALRSPGKVMVLVENFEKKENEVLISKSKSEFRSNEKLAGKLAGETGHLDKSRSTPAFNTMDLSEYLERKSRFAEEGKENVSSLVGTKAISLPYQVAASGEKPPVNYQSKPLLKYNKNDCKVKEKVFKNINPKETCNLTKNGSPEKTLPEVSAVEAEKKINTELERDCFQYECESNGNSINIIKSISDNKSSHGKLTKKSVIEPLQVEYQQKPEQTKESSPLLSPHLVISSKNVIPIKPIPAQRKSKMPPETLNNSSLTPPGPLPPKPRTKLPTPEPHPKISPNSSNAQSPPEPPPRPESTFTKVPPKNRDSTVPLRKYDGSTSTVSDIVRVLPDSGTPNRKGIVISAPISTTTIPQTLSFDLKPPSATPSSPVKKTAKSSSSDKEKSKTSGSTLESLKAMLTLGKKPANINSPRSIRKKNAMLASE